METMETPNGNNWPPGLAPGQRLGPYVLQSVLGQGGMAVVIKAWHENLQCFHALKFPMPNNTDPDRVRDFYRRFLGEARVLARLKHHNIVRILSFSDDSATHPFFSMEFIEGQGLDDYLKLPGHEEDAVNRGTANHQRCGRCLSVKEAYDILLPVASALDYAHSQGIIHRDLKPANVLLEGSTTRTPHVVDFGIAKLYQESENTKLTQMGMAIGTPEYMAPEQAQGKEPDNRADIYSLGIIAYEMLCGRPPFIRSNDTGYVTVLVNQVQTPPPPPTQWRKDLPQFVAQALLNALAKDPGQRPRSCTEFVEVLRPPDRVPVGGRQRFLMPSLVGVGLLLVVGGLIRGNSGSFTSVPTQPPPPTIDPRLLESKRLSDQGQQLVNEGATDAVNLDTLAGKPGTPKEAILSGAAKLKAKFEKAHELLLRAIQLNERNENAWHQLCRCEYYLDLCSAPQTLRRAQALFPQNSNLQPLEAFIKKGMSDGCNK